ncbi:MAG TPA: hypothetical protein VJV78_04420 [Polyangiales bacterium]|nr:hypothetical protein [Polyangiales bacterium]
MSHSDHSPQPSAQVALLTCEQDLASSISPETRGVFPPVLASARMIALMELAAARCLEPLLGSGERSVGVGQAIEHTKPTPLGAHVVVHARWVGRVTSRKQASAEGVTRLGHVLNLDQRRAGRAHDHHPAPVRSAPVRESA